VISNLFKNLHKILSRDRKKLIACNALFFGVFLVASTYVGYFAIQLHESTRTLLVKNLKTDPIFSTAYEAYYIKKNPLEALFLTFMVNYFIGALLSITLPGFFFLTIPFTALRAMLWGRAISNTINSQILASDSNSYSRRGRLRNSDGSRH